MAESDYVFGEMDVTEQKTTYERVMGFGSRHGVGISLGLSVFFTLLLIKSGLIAAFFGALITYIVTYFIVKMFFTH